MTTSSPTSRWADTPFALIPTPSLTMDIKSHSAIHCASEMSHAHNTLIRGLNSIYLQGPHLTSSTSIHDFLFYCSAWIKTVHHHHSSEEKVLFPELENLTKDKNIMHENKTQHEGFLEGLEKFGEYVSGTEPEEYRWSDMKAKIDTFAPALLEHLRDEIDTLQSLQNYDSEQLREVWQKVENAAKGDIRLPGMFDIILPMVLGCSDRTYEGGVHNFPPFPFFFPYVVDFWFARKYRGAWRFCPCDMYGKPRPLAFTD